MVPTQTPFATKLGHGPLKSQGLFFQRRGSDANTFCDEVGPRAPGPPSHNHLGATDASKYYVLDYRKSYNFVSVLACAVTQYCAVVSFLFLSSCGFFRSLVCKPPTLLARDSGPKSPRMRMHQNRLIKRQTILSKAAKLWTRTRVLQPRAKLSVL